MNSCLSKGASPGTSPVPLLKHPVHIRPVHSMLPWPSSPSCLGSLLQSFTKLQLTLGDLLRVRKETSQMKQRLCNPKWQTDNSDAKRYGVQKKGIRNKEKISCTEKLMGLDIVTSSRINRSRKTSVTFFLTCVTYFCIHTYTNTF